MRAYQDLLRRATGCTAGVNVFWGSCPLPWLAATRQYQSNIPASLLSIRRYAKGSSSLYQHERHVFFRDGTFKQGHPRADAVSEEAKALKLRLRGVDIEPAILFKEMVASSDMSFELARVCINDYFRRLQTVSRKSRPTTIRSDRMGSTVLQWLWSKDNLWITALMEDAPFFETLCSLIIAEDLDDAIVGWLGVEEPKGFSESSSGRWRGALLRSLVTGHFLLDSGGNADNVLRTFFDVADRVIAERNSRKQRGEPASLLAVTSLWPAETKITSELKRGTYGRTDPKLFDRFMRFIHGGDRRKGGKDYQSVQLHLHHPSRPDVGPFLAYLRETFATQSVADVNLALDVWQRAGLLHNLDAANALLRLQGRLDDAEWVAGIRSQLLSHADMGPTWRDYTATVRIRSRLPWYPKEYLPRDVDYSKTIADRGGSYAAAQPEKVEDTMSR